MWPGEGCRKASGTLNCFGYLVERHTFREVYTLIFFAVVSGLCTVELVGSIEVTGNASTFAFRGVGSGMTGYICKLNGTVQQDCKSKCVA